jgi:hypothetical protein
MESYETIQKAIAGKTVEHAKALGVSTSLVSKWQEPHTDFTDSGAYNPYDRLKCIIETSFRLGTPRENALCPIYQLNHDFDLVCFDMPSVPKGDAVAIELIKTIKEFSDLAQETSKALRNSRISKGERAKIIKEGQEAIRAIGALLGVVEEMAA